MAQELNIFLTEIILIYKECTQRFHYSKHSTIKQQESISFLTVLCQLSGQHITQKPLLVLFLSWPHCFFLLSFLPVLFLGLSYESFSLGDAELHANQFTFLWAGIQCNRGMKTSVVSLTAMRTLFNCFFLCFPIWKYFASSLTWRSSVIAHVSKMVVWSILKSRVPQD